VIVATLVPLYSIDPQTRDRIYDKANTNSTIRYVNAQITQEKRMNDLLWLANHPFRGNVVGIPTRRKPDTPEGLKSWLSVGIRRVPVELPHSTELELGRPHQC
jgi:hypothetical protein